VENGWWYIRYRIDEFGTDGELYRPQRYKRLAEADTPRREVLKRRDEFLAPFNSGAINAGAAVKFCDYVTHTYEITDLPLLENGSSQDSYKSVIKTHLLPAFGKMKLRDITRQSVQAFFTKLAVTPKKIRVGKKFRVEILSLETRKKIWTALSAILASAINYKHITENPAKNIEMGNDRVGKQVNFVTRDQFFALLKLISEPYASAIFVDVLTGFRASELFGLTWKNVHKHSITIEKKYSRGYWGQPKSKASNATVSVLPAVIERIHSLKGLKVSVKAGRAVRVVNVVKSCGPDDLVFQSVYSGGPMCSDNIRNRHIKPAAKILGIPWANWLCLRRSTATWHKKSGNHVKDAQAFLRHSKSKTTLDIYTLTEDESQREALARLEQYAGLERPAGFSPDQRTLWDDPGTIIAEGSKLVN
jgi:integrase